jgi:hypothetical protein
MKAIYLPVLCSARRNNLQVRDHRNDLPVLAKDNKESRMSLGGLSQTLFLCAGELFKNDYRYCGYRSIDVLIIENNNRRLLWSSAPLSRSLFRILIPPPGS